MVVSDCFLFELFTCKSIYRELKFYLFVYTVTFVRKPFSFDVCMFTAENNYNLEL